MAVNDKLLLGTVFPVAYGFIVLRTYFFAALTVSLWNANFRNTFGVTEPL